MSEFAGKRWLTAIPLVYRDDASFWDRDCGLLTLGMLNIGIDSKFVALGKPDVRKDIPLILGELEQFRKPEWWKQWKADGVMLISWGAPRYEPIARAIKESGARLVIRLDNDGFSSPRINLFRFFKTTYIFAKDYGPRLPGLYAIAKTLCFRLFPAAYDRGVLRHFEHPHALMIESPLAQAMFARYLHAFGRADLAAKLRVVAHPVKDEFDYDSAIPKQRRLLAVSRYNTYVKDAPLLMRVLERTLPSNPDYSATLIGPGNEQVLRWHARLPESLRQRITVTGRIAHAELKRHYQESQIVIFTSRAEGFPIAGEEGLCCGCSVVAPGTLPSLQYMVSESSGTCSVNRKTMAMCDALSAEMEMWRRGFRDPKRIRDLWRPRVVASAVAAQVIRL